MLPLLTFQRTQQIPSLPSLLRQQRKSKKREETCGKENRTSVRERKSGDECACDGFFLFVCFGGGMGWGGGVLDGNEGE